MSQPGITEPDLMAQYIYEALTASAAAFVTLGFGDRIGEAPVPADYADAGSYITFQAMQPETDDVYVVGNLRVMASATWQVKAVVRDASYVKASKAAALIDTLLDDVPPPSASVTSTDLGIAGTILHSYRVATLRYPETDDSGVSWRHSGGLYRLAAQ